MSQNAISLTMPDDNYLGVRLPRELVERVDALVDRRVLGFRSRAEFIADAIRRRLEQMSEMEKPITKRK